MINIFNYKKKYNEEKTVLFRSIRINKTMFVVGWALIKGDYWYETYPENAKFFRLQRKYQDDSVRYAIYLGRLTIALIYGKQRKPS